MGGSYPLVIVLVNGVQFPFQRKAPKMISTYLFMCLFCLYIAFVVSKTDPPNINDKPTLYDESRNLTEDEKLRLVEALKKAQEIATELKKKEFEEANSKPPGSDKGTSTAKLESLHATSSENQQRGRDAAQCSTIASQLPGSVNEPISLRGTGLGESLCYEILDCTAYTNMTFRTIDGRCNNLVNGLAGMAGTPSIRLLPAAYDGTDAPRQHDSEGKRLTPARTISEKVFRVAEVFNCDMSIMAMQWGQFLDHDITKTPVFQLSVTKGKFTNIHCCPESKHLDQSYYELDDMNCTVKTRKQLFHKERHPECFPIKIEPTDILRKKYKVSCMNFVRSLPSPDIHCTLSGRQQMNAITHFIDASNVYGSSAYELSTLRNGSRLRTQKGNLLPAAGDSKECPKRNGQYCFLAGDGRVNEQTGLTMMHTIWMREHNRIADFIENNTPNCSEDEIFETARRIVGAEIQHITYNEYLRFILGEDYLVNYELAPETNIDGYYPYFPNYNESINPSIANSFNTAAFRFGHSMIRGFMEFHSEKGLKEGRYLRSQFFAPYGIYDKSFRSGLSRGLGRSVAQETDESFSPEVSHHLFQGEDELIGLDLRALNVQRGRDHGLPPYNDFRELCNLKRIDNFEEFTREGFYQSVEVKDALTEVYSSPADIDLFVGGMLEKRVDGTALGETFLCIVGDQFQRLKIADRYFYDNKDQPKPFSENQLLEIKTKLTLASVMCLNRDDEKQTMQREIFKSPLASTGLVDCDEIQEMDLALFLEA